MEYGYTHNIQHSTTIRWQRTMKNKRNLTQYTAHNRLDIQTDKQQTTHTHIHQMKLKEISGDCY